jgi:hypothetical protein
LKEIGFRTIKSIYDNSVNNKNESLMLVCEQLLKVIENEVEAKDEENFGEVQVKKLKRNSFQVF